MRTTMMDRAVNKATCGFTHMGQRCVSQKIAGKAFVMQNERMTNINRNVSRMVAVQMAKKAPEMPPVVSPTEGEVRTDLAIPGHSVFSPGEYLLYEF